MSVDLTGPVSLNLGGVHDELVPVGWHTVTIERADAKLSKKDEPSIFVMSRISDEVDPNFNETVVWNLTDTGNPDDFQMKLFKRCAEALGLPEELNYPSYQALADDLIGRTFDCKVSHQVYMGENKTNVNQWRPTQYQM